MSPLILFAAMAVNGGDLGDPVPAHQDRGEVGPIRATIITYFNPAVGLVLGVLLLVEPFTVGSGLWFALIAFGSFVATRRTRRSEGITTAPDALSSRSS